MRGSGGGDGGGGGGGGSGAPPDSWLLGVCAAARSPAPGPIVSTSASVVEWVCFVMGYNNLYKSQ